MAPTVLVVKLAAIGDVAMALPMVTALRAQHPRCHITWLCGQSVEPLLQCVEGIDEIVVADERALLAGSRRKQTAAVLKIWRRLAGRRFDLTVTAHSDRRYLWLTLPIRAGIRRQFHDGLGTSRSGRGRYYGDEYVRLVTDIDDYRATRYLPPRINVAPSAKLLALLSGHNIGAQPLIALAPGG